METNQNTTNPADLNWLQILTDFVNQRPGFSFADYGDYKAYRQDYRTSLQQRNDFYDLKQGLQGLAFSQANGLIYKALQDSNGRLQINKSGNGLVYHAGQYAPTEYRGAAARLLASVLWDYIRDNNPEWNGEQIRTKAKKALRTRSAKQYFR